MPPKKPSSSLDQVNAALAKGRAENNKSWKTASQKINREYFFRYDAHLKQGDSKKTAFDKASSETKDKRHEQRSRDYFTEYYKNKDAESKGGGWHK